MIKFEFKNYRVISETDYTENGVDYIECAMEVNIGVVGDEDNAIPAIKMDLIVINTNTQTGVQMDEQRKAEAIAYVANNFVV